MTDRVRFSADSPGSPVSRAKKLKLEKQVQDPLFYQYKEELEYRDQIAMEVSGGLSAGKFPSF